MKCWIRLMQVAALCGCVMGSGLIARAEPLTTSPTTKPSAKPVRRNGPPPELAKAITELNKEAQDYLDKPDSSTLRTVSNYFKSGKLPDDVTVDDVVAAIDGGMSGNAFQVAYVKWQLLSACQGKLTPEQQQKLMEAYNEAPAPLLRFTGESSIRTQLENAAKGKKEDFGDTVNPPLEEQKKKIDDVNKPILLYRDTLYSKLPVSVDSLNACMRDMVVRMNAGVSPTILFQKFQPDCLSWLAVDATPQQASMILSSFRQVKRVKGPTILGSYGADKNGKVGWQGTLTPALSPDQIKLVEPPLLAFIKHPQQNTLHFKDK